MSKENKAEWNPIFQAAAASWNMSVLEMEEAINFGPPAIGIDVTDYGVTEWSGRAPLFTACDPLTSKHNQMQFIQINTRQFTIASDRMKQSTAAHEFGHVLGLKHPSDQVEDMGSQCDEVVLMNHYWIPRETCDVYRPRPDDITGVSMLYDDNIGESRSTSKHTEMGSTDLTEAPSDGAVGVYLDYVKGYDSIEEVSADATAELVVKPTGTSRVEYISGGPDQYSNPVPFTVTEAKVVSAGSGDFESGDIVNIRQDGNREEYAVNAAELLEEGSEYLVYLKPWDGPGGTGAEQHIIVGGQAAWKLSTEEEGRGVIASGDTQLPSDVNLSHQRGQLRVASAD
ncbi:hypothetical protein AAG589_20985 [Isoptericola sp. F-RaC21]|uniref:hypothetical protein n=1 Tax=Isoptericola sp. F-RaC21 TaxID=3141452 RepID=UPI00315BAC49